MFEFLIRDLFYYFQLNIGIISIAFNRVRTVAFRSASFSCKFSLNTFIIHMYNYIFCMGKLADVTFLETEPAQRTFNIAGEFYRFFTTLSDS